MVHHAPSLAIYEGSCLAIFLHRRPEKVTPLHKQRIVDLLVHANYMRVLQVTSGSKDWNLRRHQVACSIVSKPSDANAPKRLRMTVCACYISITYAISQSLPTCISPQSVNFYSHISEDSSLRTSQWPRNMMFPPPGGRTFPEPHRCVLMTIQVDMILHHLLPHRDRITASALHDFDCPHPYDKSLSHRMHHNDIL